MELDGRANNMQKRGSSETGCGLADVIYSAVRLGRWLVGFWLWPKTGRRPENGDPMTTPSPASPPTRPTDASVRTRPEFASIHPHDITRTPRAKTRRWRQASNGR